jgi:predicted CoA-binding protein
MNHDEDYPAGYLATILKEVKSIAVVGASSDPTRFSYGVMRVLHETGYEMIPVNPLEAGKEIRGLKVYESLSAIGKPVDMVQVFRTSDAALDVAKEAVDRRQVLLHRRAMTGSGWPRMRAQGGDEPPQDRTVPPLLEASSQPADLNGCRPLRRRFWHFDALLISL